MKEREIKFRGKTINNSHWVYGDLVKNEDRYYIIPYNADFSLDYYAELTISIFYEINPETIGQFTGLKDKNGKEIYEGDIVIKMTEDFSVTRDWLDDDDRWRNDLPKIEAMRDVVSLENFRFWLVNEKLGYEGEELIYWEDCETIGTIHDNPELLK